MAGDIIKRVFLLCVAFLVALVAPISGDARGKKGKRDPMQQNDFDRYVEQMRNPGNSADHTPGSLWSPASRFADLAGDYKAVRAGDIITINIVTQTTAANSGNIKSQRSFTADMGINSMFGQIGPTSGLQNMFSPRSQHALTGQAQTASTSQLTTSLSGVVKEVLPNGLFVIEAHRDMLFDNQHQKVTLRGLVRPGDLAPDNSVMSTAVAHLTVQVEGKGVISDGVHQPNPLVRMILRVLEF